MQRIGYALRGVFVKPKKIMKTNKTIKHPTKSEVDAMINKAISEQNHFHSHCTIYNYYGSAATARSATPTSMRAEGKIPYAYVRYGSPYDKSKSEGELIRYSKEYLELKPD